MKYREVEWPERADLFNWFCVQIENENFKVGVMYRPPSYSRTQLLNNLDYIMGLYKKNHMIVADFNINLLEENTTQVVNDNNTVLLNSFVIKGELNASNDARKTPTSMSLIEHLLIKRKNFELQTTKRRKLLSDNNRLLISIARNFKSHKPKNNTIIFVNHNKFRKLFSIESSYSNIESFQHLIELIKQRKRESEYTRNLRCYRNDNWITSELLSLIRKHDKPYKTMKQ
ncbi:hypothetical protein HHI36_003020 [Cryptolaemus montrouzieri]|uniref:Uncharacterized protein n=1 Tax=Cryptolaemus montrouzieri TaxID=559131 RepID=A0ABD2PCR3_9CUCU